MNTANFPGLVNSRRMVALENLKRALKSAINEPDKRRIEKEIEVLQARLVSDGEARATRTKKTRGVRRSAVK